MIILLKLLFVHLAGDFLLQPKSWVNEKEQKKIKSVRLYLHIFIHGALTFLVLWDTNLWMLALSIMIFHGIIDIGKVYLQNENNKAWWFIIDQLLHLSSIVLLWYIWFHPAIQMDKLFQNPFIWICSIAILFLTVVSGIIMQLLMANWSQQISDGEDESLANAGKYIGILERLFVFTFVLTGHWEAIGFLLAAKSIFRFGDLKESKDRKLTEYILIGTLLSFGIAILIGMVVAKIIQYTGIVLI